MRIPHARLAALIATTISVACGAPEAEDRAVVFEPVLLGQTELRGILAPLGSAQVRVSGDPELSALLTQDASRIDVSFSPILPVPASAEVEVLNAQGQLLSRIRLRGNGRAPELSVVPTSVQLATSVGARYAQSSLWVWPESDVSVQVADTQWPPCPAPGACAQVHANRAQRGLPAAISLRVDSTAQVPSTITLRSCDHPGCAVTVEVHAPIASGGLHCSPSVLEMPAAAVGRLSSAVLRCEGEPWTATSPHPNVSVVMTSSTTAQVQWLPQAPGSLTTMIDLGGSNASVPLRGYALDAPGCALAVTPERLSFGQVAVNATAQGRLSLSNIGNSDCLVADVQAQPAGQFSVEAALPQWLASGQHLELQAHFTPHRPGAHQGTAEVQAATMVPLVADLEGQGVQASLRIEPPVIELGSLAQCGLQTVPIVIVNEGGAPGLVTGIEVSTQGPVQVRFSVGLPVTIPAGASFSLLALVEAQGPGPVAAQVRVELDQGGTAAWTQAQLNATVSPLPTQEDEFEQLALPQVDVLVVVDDGPGFGQEQAYLQNSLGELASNPTWSSVDARFAVMAASLADPNRVGRLIPEAEPSLQVVSSTVAEVRRDAVMDLVRRVGTSNSTRSEGLQAVLQTLTQPGGDAQTRFLRPEAQLGIFVMSSRDDASADPVADYASGLQQVLGPRSSHRLQVSTVTGPLPSGCADGNLQAEAAPRYREVAQRTGGLNLDICDRRWPAYLIPRNVRFGFKSRFYLSEPALEPTIEVYVQGERIPQYSSSGTINWAYDVVTNSVNFSPFAVPEPSAEIRVRYQVACS